MQSQILIDSTQQQGNGTRSGNKTRPKTQSMISQIKPKTKSHHWKGFNFQVQHITKLIVSCNDYKKQVAWLMKTESIPGTKLQNNEN